MATKTTTTKRATKAAPTRTVARGTGRTVAGYIAAAPKAIVKARIAEIEKAG